MKPKASGIRFNILLEIGSSSHVFCFSSLHQKPWSSLRFHSQMKYATSLVGKCSEHLSVLSLLKWLTTYSLKFTLSLASEISPFLVFLLPLDHDFMDYSSVTKALNTAIERVSNLSFLPSVFVFLFLYSFSSSAIKQLLSSSYTQAPF